mmetsp:Transcript_19180/g.39603  ORF Transcript_19180/g.39603 Transcript_19180/m.39603 type:complete len:255 (-) Transcript_19180:1044-1808(-)
MSSFAPRGARPSASDPPSCALAPAARPCTSRFRSFRSLHVLPTTLTPLPDLSLLSLISESSASRALSFSSTTRANFLASCCLTALFVASSCRSFSSRSLFISSASLSLRSISTLPFLILSLSSSIALTSSDISLVSLDMSSPALSSTSPGSPILSATASAKDSPTAPISSLYVGLPSKNCIPAASNRPSPAARHFISVKWVVAATLAPSDTRPSTTARARATPWSGDVPLPISSRTTRLGPEQEEEEERIEPRV